MLGASLSSKPDSKRFYALTAAVAATWTVGGIASGPLHRGEMRRPVIDPVITGVGAFSSFYAAALVCKRIPVLNSALQSIMSYAHEGPEGLVLMTTLANGVAEEVFFRGAVYEATDEQQAIAKTTAAYMVATLTTRNPALVLASGVMGGLFALQRQQSGGIQAPMLTHLVWSSLMLHYLPPLFPSESGSSRRTKAH